MLFLSIYLSPCYPYSSFPKGPLWINEKFRLWSHFLCTHLEKWKKDIALWKPLSPMGMTALGSRSMLLLAVKSAERERTAPPWKESEQWSKWCFHFESLAGRIHLSPLAVHGAQGSKPFHWYSSITQLKSKWGEYTLSPPAPSTLFISSVLQHQGRLQHSGKATQMQQRCTVLKSVF